MDTSEAISKRFGWMLSSVSILIASFALYKTLEKNGADFQAALEAQQQGLIAQALSTLQVPSAPGTARALQLIARKGVPVNGLHLEGAYLQRTDLSNLQASNAVFDRADLLGVNFQGADISEPVNDWFLATFDD